MLKTISATVTGPYNGLKLEHFLKAGLLLSKREISRAKFRENGICVNGKRKKTDSLLKTGDIVEILLETGHEISENLSPSKEDVCVLYEDNDVIVLDKPAGISVHPAGRKEQDTLANRLAFYLHDKNEDSVIRILGRLDKDTSGAVIAAKSRAAAARLARQRETGIFRKSYLAITGRVPEPQAGVIRLPIGISPENRKQTCITPDGKAAVTHYETLQARDGCAFVRFFLETGRTHQIRVHMAAIGCPLLGDPIYGTGIARLPADVQRAFSSDAFCNDSALLEIRRTALHARSIRFRQPFTGKEFLIEAPVPDDMRLCLSNRSGMQDWSVFLHYDPNEFFHKRDISEQKDKER